MLWSESVSVFSRITILSARLFFIKSILQIAKKVHFTAKVNDVFNRGRKP